MNLNFQTLTLIRRINIRSSSNDITSSNGDVASSMDNTAKFDDSDTYHVMYFSQRYLIPGPQNPFHSHIHFACPHLIRLHPSRHTPFVRPPNNRPPKKIHVVDFETITVRYMHLLLSFVPIFSWTIFYTCPSNLFRTTFSLTYLKEKLWQ